jgi:hypothetical protein
MNVVCTVDQRDDITLVELDVKNPTRTARKIRIENTLAGDILPPRHHGTPVEGWDADGVTVSVDAGERRALGYACRARPEDPPARIVASEPTDSGDTPTRTAGTVVAALGDPRPPRDAVTAEHRGDSSAVDKEADSAKPSTSREVESGMRERSTQTRSSDIPPGQSDSEGPTAEDPRGRTGRPVLAGSAETEGADAAPIPPAIDAWLQRTAKQVAAEEGVDTRVLSAVSRRAAEIVRRAER